MGAKVLTGVGHIKMGACGANGVMGSTLTAFSKIENDSVVLTFDEPSKEVITCEDLSAPLVTLTDPSVVRKLEFGTHDFDPDTLALVFGGSVASNKWSAPVSFSPIEKSVEVVTKAIDGTYYRVQVPRANVSASMSGKIGKKGVGALKVVCEVLMPFDGTGAALSPITIEEVTA